MPAPEVYLAVVQRDDEPAHDETEAVTITVDAAGLPTIELTSGVRIRATVRMTAPLSKEAAA